MLRSSRIVIAAAAAVPLAACAPQAEPGSGPVSKAPAIVATGPAVNCVQTNRIRDTEVFDDNTIDFHMIDGTTYRNTLPNRCPSLGFEERFGYRTTTGRLCSVDIIHVLYSDGSQGAGCGLGEFLPVKINQPDAD
ncbi:DUF6491 family protein [Croceibacterium aestuarii]|uniref:DUF6491 family protein n=1 Tax=Croceibacterium aestuarii TaxID=3064139 RepID=UPI00272DC9D7|nr:DUF6491 family protein [Croceibacterium sp. D39]